MKDQADKLRQVIDKLKSRQIEYYDNRYRSLNKASTKVITVTSGKGGVGKTNITINLAISLSEMGYRVIILDADFGLANIDVLLGVSPQYTLVDVIRNKKNIIEVLTNGPNNIKFVSGGSGVEELVRLDRVQVERFINNIALLDKIADIVIIDTGAGLSESVMSFVASADEVVLVTTPEPTSITDAYALVKMVSNRYKNKVIKVIVNRAESTKEANDILAKLSLVAEKFLSVNLIPIGYILQDDTVIKAVKMQQPFTIVYPKSQASRYIREISRKLVEDDTWNTNREDSGVKGFINRLVNFMKT
ncbi:MAG: MinD/ParA family protein [Acetivibrionales bacterium]|jgi:flagellar biosynthesis protein FlhG